eukprot:724544-Rhodomonas_salina.1
MDVDIIIRPQTQREQEQEQEQQEQEKQEQEQEQRHAIRRTDLLDNDVDVVVGHVDLKHIQHADD